jgi:hypothetical protein
MTQRKQSTSAKIETWNLFPERPQLPIKDPRSAVRRLQSQCDVLAMDDGTLLLTGRADVFTKDFRDRLLPYVTEIWNAIKGKKT